MAHRPFRTTTLLLAVLGAALAGCTQAGTPAAAPTASTPSAAGTPTAAGTAAPAGTAGAPGSGIPVEAFGEPSTGMRVGPVREWTTDPEALPAVCGGAFAAGDGATARASVRSVYKRPEDRADDPYGTHYQTITTYRAGAAAGFMDRLRDALRTCPTDQVGGVPVRLEVVELGDRMTDDGLRMDLIRRHGGGERTTATTVIRHGDVVTVLHDEVRGGDSTVPRIVDSFLRDALEALVEWRG
jgi:hypothetical protein